jgi:hypothetical protein
MKLARRIRTAALWQAPVHPPSLKLAKLLSWNEYTSGSAALSIKLRLIAALRRAPATRVATASARTRQLTTGKLRLPPVNQI